MYAAQWPESVILRQEDSEKNRRRSYPNRERERNIMIEEERKIER